MVLPFNVALYSGVSVAALFAAAGADAYAVGGNSPEFVADFAGTLNSGTEYYRSGGSDTTFSSAFTFTRPTTATYVNSSGVLTTASSGVARRGHHVWNGSSWENAGILIEPAAATNLLLNSGTLSTQSVTVTAVAHTLHFTGTGTITLSGASTAGPLVGTGTGENNRVSLTFTPSAGSLTCTVSGTVTNAQLEVGSVRTSYIPTAGSTVTRAAETVSSTAVSYSGTATSVHWKGYATYADDNGAQTCNFIRWLAAATDYFALRLNTQSASTGRPTWVHVAGGVLDVSFGVTTLYAPGVNVPMNMAARSTTSTCQVGAEGVANTADNTVTAMPTGLGSAAFELTQSTDVFPRTISLVRKWSTDIGESGIEEAST